MKFWLRLLLSKGKSDRDIYWSGSFWGLGSRAYQTWNSPFSSNLRLLVKWPFQPLLMKHIMALSTIVTLEKDGILTTGILLWFKRPCKMPLLLRKAKSKSLTQTMMSTIQCKNQTCRNPKKAPKLNFQSLKTSIFLLSPLQRWKSKTQKIAKSKVTTQILTLPSLTITTLSPNKIHL